MNLISKLTTAAAVATIAAGAGATAASAYSISGGAYTSGEKSVTFTFAGAYTIECSYEMSGSATGSDTTAFTPSLDGCGFFGFPFAVTSGPWSLQVDAGGPGAFGGTLRIPVGTTMTWSSGIMGCTITFTGPQSFNGAASLTNTATGAELAASLGGLAYTAIGCPFSSGTDGQYETNGVVSLPGVTIS